ncbi:hypothetical protein OG500_14260 [Kitasatospora sp. NBC_01250]|uniref:hypothetical protein n=1 Tax=unclassified Kitasatospora TaxID=2633591 RepID=UPI002E0F495C|nr:MULTISPECIES: hypothetical protein [unclassified Kitasatospora]WSJ67407.1 hypothetical protein OG294_15525 [Kitasatospora sp. NBC_01302]
MSHQICPRCGGTGVTEKIRHTVETEPDGTRQPKQENYLSPCAHCGGKGHVN